jgi:adenylosuccinate synthase
VKRGANLFVCLGAYTYVARLSELVGCEIGIVSTGPERHATILRPKSAVASWFD